MTAFLESMQELARAALERWDLPVMGISPIKVREEPTTPCTIEMLPASRLESCARNRVGRRPLIRCSLRNAPGSAAFGMPASTAASTS